MIRVFILAILVMSSCNERRTEVRSLSKKSNRIDSIKPLPNIDSLHREFERLRLKPIKSTKTLRRDVPSSQDNRPALFYVWDRLNGDQLGLDSLINGFDSIEIRFWYDYSLIKEQKLVVVKCQNGKWSAEDYTLIVNWDGYVETILAKKVMEVKPKSGWKAFTKRLFELGVMTLPDSEKIPHYMQGMDGLTINVELATKNLYRFYSYWGPALNKDKIWQAKQFIQILTLLNDELGVRANFD